MDVWLDVPECETGPLYQEATGSVSVVTMISLEQRIGIDAVRLLVQLLHSSHWDRGRRLAYRSSRELADELGGSNAGWGRQALMPRLRHLKDLGLIADAKKGAYELNPALLAGGRPVENSPARHESQTGTSLTSDHTGPVFTPRADRTGLDSGPVGDRTGTTADLTGLDSGPVDDPMSEDEDDNEHVISNPLEQLPKLKVDVVVATLEEFGCQGKLLDAIRQDPVRAVAWWQYAVARRQFEPRRFGPPFLNHMLLTPDNRGAWPDGLQDLDRRHLTVRFESSGPLIVHEDGRPWTPIVPLSQKRPSVPRVPSQTVTVAMVETELIDAEPGELAPADDPYFQQDVDAYVEMLRRETDIDPVRVLTVAKLRALQDRGRLTGVGVPDAWLKAARVAF